MNFWINCKMLVLLVIRVAPTQEHETSHQPSSLSCTAFSSFSSSPPSAWLSPPRPPAAHICLSGREKEFLCGISGFAVLHLCDVDPCCPSGADNSLHACSNWGWGFGVAAALRHVEKEVWLLLRRSGTLSWGVMCMSGSAFQRRAVLSGIWCRAFYSAGHSPLQRCQLYSSTLTFISTRI